MLKDRGVTRTTSMPWRHVLLRRASCSNELSAMQYGHCVCGSNTQGNELAIFSRNGAVLTVNNEKSQIPDIMVVFAHVVILYADNRFLNKLYTMSKRRGQGA
jgi:hypothetical protein